MSYVLHQGDLPADLEFSGSVAVDTETLGLRLGRDKLCVVQLSAGDGVAHLVQLDRSSYKAPRLAALMADTKILKIFHYARFDMAVLKRYLGVDVGPVYCTKIVSKLVRTYTDSHGLKDLCNELLDKKISKQQQSSDWGSASLSKAQCAYAAADVLYLHGIQEKLEAMLQREGRQEMAQRCFDFLPVRVELDMAGWEDKDIFSHSDS